MHVSLDRHYCDGKLAEIKFSLTGKMGTCGMEAAEISCLDVVIIKNKCCEDQIIFYDINSKYFPEYFRLTHPTAGKDIPVAPVSNIHISDLNVVDHISRVLPPGDNNKACLTLPEICVFRI